MTASRNRLSEALANARRIRAEVGAEIRGARLQSGIGQRAAASAVGMSHAQLGRIERGEVAELTIEQASRACAAVGLKLVTRAYPDGDPVRDHIQLALLDRFERLLPPGTRFRREVPLALPGDRRAWDGAAYLAEGALYVEAESRLRDVQALERKVALKKRDDDVDIVLLLVNDTPANREVVREHGAALAAAFPGSSREVLLAIRAGRRPSRSCLLFA